MLLFVLERWKKSLFGAISRQERRALRPVGSTHEQQRRLTTAAIEEQRSVEKDPNEEQIRRHAEASKPEGLAEPKVLKATDLISAPFMPSYVTKCGE